MCCVSQESQAIPLENVAKILGDGSPGRSHRRLSYSGEEAIAEKLAHGSTEKKTEAGLSAPLSFVEWYEKVMICSSCHQTLHFSLAD